MLTSVCGGRLQVSCAADIVFAFRLLLAIAVVAARAHGTQSDLDDRLSTHDHGAVGWPVLSVKAGTMESARRRVWASSVGRACVAHGDLAHPGADQPPAGQPIFPSRLSSWYRPTAAGSELGGMLSEARQVWIAPLTVVGLRASFFATLTFTPGQRLRESLTGEPRMAGGLHLCCGAWIDRAVQHGHGCCRCQWYFR